MNRVHRCAYCGVQTVRSGSPRQHNYSTKDHVTPRMRGGGYVVRCCNECNQDKGHLTCDEWRLVLCLRYRKVILFHFERLELSVCLWTTIITAQNFLLSLSF